MISVSKEIRFAVIGCGLMGKRHAEIICRTPGARLVAVFDTNPYSDDFRAFLPTETRFSASYDEIVTNPEIDGVVICLPSFLHAEYGIIAAQHGKHVITEKPIDVSLEAAKNLITECSLNNVQCHTISQNRFSDAMRSLKIAVEQGLLGKIVLLEASVKWYRHDEYYTESSWRGRISGEGGGVIMNQAIHFIDLLIWLFGVPESVLPILSTNRAGVMETEDTAVASIKFPNGIIAAFAASTTTFPGYKETLSVYGDTGACTIEQGQITYWNTENNIPAPAPLPTSPRETDATCEGKFQLFQRQYFNIIDSIIGTSHAVVTADEALATLETARKFYK